jgi:hypothetical protein
MDSTFGILDAFAFVVFGVLILVAFVIIVSLGKLPGQLARKWGAPASGGDQRDELDGHRNGRPTLADRFHLGVYSVAGEQSDRNRERSALEHCPGA